MYRNEHFGELSTVQDLEIEHHILLEAKYVIENLYVRRQRSLLTQMYGQSKVEINLVENKCDRILRSAKNARMKY